MLREGLLTVLTEYGSSRSQGFTGHPIGKLLRHDLPELLEMTVIDPEIYSFDGSAGAGNWARCPWVAVFDESVTNSAQRGFYPVYLFRENMGGVYLSLNQGVTDVKAEFGRHARRILGSRAENFRDQIAPIPRQFNNFEIDLDTQNSAELATYYEDGNICSTYYTVDNMPTNDQLVSDFLEMMRIYGILAGRVDIPISESQKEEEEVGLSYEDLRKIRTHKRLERNQTLSKMAKRIHGYVCEACGFDFEATYGDIGHKFIEAHHLVPISEKAGELVETDPKTDFAVLCSNCHRMIHKADNPGNIEKFRARMKTK
jgi:5-methylcytosine-specific restriction enzyme A